jgi:chaperonin cofactor prefoldin
MKMSKFVEIAVKNSTEETAKQKAERIQPILKSKLEAKLKAQEAVIIEKEIELKEAEEIVEKSTGTMTTNPDFYLNEVFVAMQNRDEIAAQLAEAEALLDEMTELLRIFE